MAEIRNLTRNGEVFYPLTHNEAVIGMNEFKETIINQVAQYKPIEITGDVTNAPDEEDITTDANNLLKFKDRNNLYGLGKVILRRDKTFSAQVTLANTIYVIQYNFDLNNERVILPLGAILLFEGGSINNGTLVGNGNRLVYYQELSEIMTDLTLEGTFVYKACDKDTIGSISVDNSSIEENELGQLSVKANGIQNTHLNGNVVDQVGLVLDSNNKISLKDGGVTNSKLDSSIVDNSSIALDTNNKISIKTSGVQGINLNSNIVNTDDLVYDNTNHNIKFADRTYNSLSPNGMGRVILRNNLVEGVNTLTQSMINKVNTIYVIQYDFTLGEDITVPANCVLEFGGGSLSGDGTGKDIITGNNTIIKGSQDCISNVILAGTFKNDVALISWFSNNTDLALTNAILLGTRIYVDKDITLTKDIMISKSNVTIESKHNTITNGIYSIGISNVSNVIIKGINFLGTVDDTQTTANILGFNQTDNCHVEDCIVDGSFFYGIIFVLSTNCSIDSCIFKQSYNQAAQMLCSGRVCNYLYIRNNNFTNIGYVPPIQLNNCTYSYVEDNVCINVDNNPIFISSGCAHCTVKGNYIGGSRDSGIILANDYILVPDGQGSETISTDLPYDISIIGNYIYDCSDAGIALYHSYNTGTIIRNITIANNILKNNGVRQSGSQKFKSNILIGDTYGVSIVGNTIIVSDNTYGIFLCKNLSNSYDAIIGGYNHIIMGNSINANSIGTDVGSTNSQVVALKTDIGFPIIQNFNIYKHDNGGSYPDSKTGVFTWGQNPGDYAVACDFTQIDQNILGIHNTASPAAEVSLNLTFDDLSLFAYNCIFTIKGLIKASDASSIGRVTIRQNGDVTSNRIRINSPIIRSTSWVPFEISGLYNAGNVQKLEVLFTGTNTNQWTYFKDVVFEIRYL